LLRDSTSLPTIYALYRARKYLDERNCGASLVITGGLRVSSDFAKAIAMGADAVAVATASLMAAACQQYRVCGSGKCPVGIATQDEELRSAFDAKAAALRVANFFNVTLKELKTYARITGRAKLHDLSAEDLVTINSEISGHTNIPHA
jgi:glutamate synthase domain-containing protein 2